MAKHKDDTLWVYKDKAGIDSVVQGLDNVPPEFRAKAHSYDTTKGATKHTAEVHTTSRAKPDDIPATTAIPVLASQPSALSVVAPSLHMPSFLMGAGAALFIALILTTVFRANKRLATMALGVLMAAAVATGYLTFLRSQVSPLQSGIATPSAIIDDARRAAEALQQNTQRQKQVLEGLEK